MIWIEAFLQVFKAQLPQELLLKSYYGKKLDFRGVHLLLDGCDNPELLALLKNLETELLIDGILLEWLTENLTIDK